MRGGGSKKLEISLRLLSKSRYGSDHRMDFSPLTKTATGVWALWHKLYKVCVNATKRLFSWKKVNESGSKNVKSFATIIGLNQNNVYRQKWILCGQVFWCLSRKQATLDFFFIKIGWISADQECHTLYETYYI